MESKIILKLSIIIPVLNDQKALKILLEYLKKHQTPDIEIIVVDGGSDDDSINIAKHYADFAIVSEAGRAMQMNAGAKIAKGELLWFLHADSQFKKNPINKLLKTNSPWGFFKVYLNAPILGFRVIEFMMNWRSRLTAIATGDQAIFIRKKLFEQKQGFDNIVLMEDIALSKKLKSIEPLFLDHIIITSARKWQNNGIIKTVLLMWLLRLKYFFGVNPQKLKQQYYP